MTLSEVWQPSYVIFVQVDARFLVPVLEKLDKIMADAVADLPHSIAYNEENTLLIATLKYLAYTLKNSVSKHFFLSLEVNLSPYYMP